MKPRILFFALYTCLAVPGQFNPLFLQHHEQSQAQVGILLSVFEIASFISAPFLCRVADRFSSHELALVVLASLTNVILMLQALALPAFYIVPPHVRFPWLLCTTVLRGMLTAPLAPLANATCIKFLRSEHGPVGHIYWGRERLWASLGWAVGSISIGALLDFAPYGIWQSSTSCILSSTFPSSPSCLSSDIDGNDTSNRWMTKYLTPVDNINIIQRLNII